MKVRMLYRKETKHTVVYEAEPEARDPIVRAVYVDKGPLGHAELLSSAAKILHPGWPPVIILTIEAEESK